MNAATRNRARTGAETEDIGEALAPELRSGDVVLLQGDLAAGKTTLVRGVVRGLRGAEEAVASPTFVLIHSYDCDFNDIETIHHVDLYRLDDRVTDLREIGMEDILSDPKAVILVEWPKNTIATWIPKDARIWRIDISLEKDDSRNIVITPPQEF